MRDDRAAADGVDEDVDGAEFLRHGGGDGVDLARVEHVGASRMGAPAGRAQFGDGIVKPALVDINRDHDRPLARHDAGGGAADPARRRSDDRYFAGKAHPLPPVFQSRPPSRYGEIQARGISAVRETRPGVAPLPAPSASRVRR
jgi:hypothetical protein